MFSIRSIATLSITALACGSFAQASLTEIPKLGIEYWLPNQISGDGSTVLGYDGDFNIAIWKNGVISDAPFIVELAYIGRFGLTYDGRLMGSGDSGPFIWSPTTGTQMLPGNGGPFLMSGDGKVMVGRAGDQALCYWDSTGFHELPSTNDWQEVYAINYDGSQFGGASSDYPTQYFAYTDNFHAGNPPTAGSAKPVLYTRTGSTYTYSYPTDSLPGQNFATEGRMACMQPDGSFITNAYALNDALVNGTYQLANCKGVSSFLHSPGHPVSGVGSPQNLEAFACSSNGKVVVGRKVRANGAGFSIGDGMISFGNDTEDVKQFAAERGLDLSKWSGIFLFGCSADGTRILGTGYDPAGHFQNILLSVKARALAFAPDSNAVQGGSDAGAFAILDYVAGTGMKVSVSSDNSSVVPSGTYPLPVGDNYAPFQFHTNKVGADTLVDVTFTMGTSKATVPLLLTADVPSSPSLAAISANPSAVASGTPGVTGTVSFTGPLPSGASVMLGSGNATAVTLPPVVYVKGGAQNAQFPISTHGVDGTTLVSIVAHYNGHFVQSTMTVLPLSIRGISATPNPVVGGSNVNVTLTFNGLANNPQPGTFTSSNPAVLP